MSTANSYASYFSYNLSRPYPFKWITPLVLVGAPLIILVTTVVSISTSGYELSTTYSYDPNATEAKHTYFSQWPSFMTANTQATCNSASLPIGSNFFTNNTAFSYTITSIWQGSGADSKLLDGGLPYHNNRLDNCSVSSLGITFESFDRTGAQIARAEWGTSLEAFISCSLYTPEGPMHVNFTTDWDWNPSHTSFDHPSTQFPGVNQSSGSLWWGESLMAWYYLALINNTVIAAQEAGAYKGYVTMNRTSFGLATTYEQVKSLDFFSGDLYFVPYNKDGEFSDRIIWSGRYLVSQMIDGPWLPSIWINVDTLSKAMYFTILADLGQLDTAHQNILTSPDMLEYYTLNFSAIRGEFVMETSVLSIFDSSLAGGPFTNANASEWQLGIQPSVISAQYLCSEPRLKQGGNLIMAILVANYVLLQSAWQIFKFAINFILARRLEVKHSIV